MNEDIDGFGDLFAEMDDKGFRGARVAFYRGLGECWRVLFLLGSRLVDAFLPS
jgi:hypothetical protein